MRKFFLFVNILNLLINFSAEAVDRKPMVVAVFSHMPALLRFVRSQESFQKLDYEDQELINEVSALAENGKIKLVDNHNASDFLDLNPGEPTRLLRTDRTKIDGPIEVNSTLLQSESLPATLRIPIIAKMLFHELGHKTNFKRWGMRDRVAQYFSSEVENFMLPVKKLPEGGEIVSMSLPISKVDTLLADIHLDELQPSFLFLLIDRAGNVTDYTQMISNKVISQSTTLRSIWSEIHQVVFSIMGDFMDLAKAFMETAADAVASPQSPFAGIISAMGAGGELSKIKANMPPVPNVKSMTLFEIHEVEALPLDSLKKTVVTLKATYHLSRTSRGFKINFSNMQIDDPIPAPLLLKIEVPYQMGGSTLSDRSMTLELRPDFDYGEIAVRRNVVRQGGTISSFKVRLKKVSLDETPLALVQCPGGYISIPSSSVEAVGSGGFDVSFDVSDAITESKQYMFVNSIQVQSNRAVFLDRELVLSDGAAEPTMQNALIAQSVGFWGLEDRQVRRRTDFSFNEVTFFLDRIGQYVKQFTLSPSRFAIDFQMRRFEAVKEVRLHFKRTLILGSITDEEMASDKPGSDDRKAMRFEYAPGKIVNLTERISPLDRADIYEVISVSKDQVRLTQQSDGTTKASVLMKAPDRWIDRPKSANEAYYVPTFTPILVEVVLESGQVLRQSYGRNFSKNEHCEAVLSDSETGKTFDFKKAAEAIRKAGRDGTFFN